MSDPVTAHYGQDAGLAACVAERLRAAGKDLGTLTTRDLAPVDEFHTRGRAATLELAARMGLAPGARVLDIGSGLGGPARAVAEAYDCHVTGVDLNAGFCRAAAEFSAWVGLQDRVAFRCGDATKMPFESGAFDAVMTLHAAMNIPAKDAVYAEARRVLNPGGVFAVYDVLQGEGGPALFPVPWARQPAASHLATPSEMRELLTAAGFVVEEEADSSAESLAWFETAVARMESAGAPAVSLHAVLGDDFVLMARTVARNLADNRIRTVSYICRV